MEDERNVGPIDQYYHEGMMARMERAQKRLWILCIILIALLFGSWVGFFVYECQYEDVSIDATETADTGNNYAIGGDFGGDTESKN